MPRAAAARKKTSARNGSGVPCPLWFPQRPGVRYGQKHLSEIYTPATTYGYSRATDRQEDEKQKDDEYETCSSTCIRHAGATATSATRANTIASTCSGGKPASGTRLPEHGIRVSAGHLALASGFMQFDCLAPSDPTSRDQPWVGPSALQGRKASMTKFWTASKCLVFAVISVAPCTIAVAPMSASASRIPYDRASKSTSSAARSEMAGVT